jgi:hypothetical protein
MPFWAFIAFLFASFLKMLSPLTPTHCVRLCFRSYFVCCI